MMITSSTKTNFKERWPSSHLFYFVILVIVQQSARFSRSSNEQGHALTLLRGATTLINQSDRYAGYFYANGESVFANLNADVDWSHIPTSLIPVSNNSISLFKLKLFFMSLATVVVALLSEA